jgi:D-inositol-3-phosphate glycosyltransferase
MKPKRILIISYHTCPLASEEGKETGGMNIYVLELARQLGKMGCQIDVITRCQDPDLPKIVQVTENFRVVHLVDGPEHPVDKKRLPALIPEFVKSFQKFAAAEGKSYDIMDAHYYLSGLIGLQINNLLPTKIPLVMTFHTLALMKNLAARSVSEQESQFRIDAEFTLTREADAIITPSASEKQYLMYLYEVPEEKIYEIPPGVNTDLFKPMDKNIAKAHIGASPNDNIILFVGRIEPLKGIDMLLYAMKILLAKNPGMPICLLIVGGDVSQHIENWSAPLKQLEQLRHTLRISTQVNFIGQRPQSELPYYYNAARLVVMPSHYESFGMAAAEAMACGVPVITTNVTGISNLIDGRYSALITAVNNPLLLASQITELLTNQVMYNNARKTIMKSVEELRWDVITEQIEAVYSRLTDKEPAVLSNN